MQAILNIYIYHDLFPPLPQGAQSVFFNKGENCIAAGKQIPNAVMSMIKFFET